MTRTVTAILVRSVCMFVFPFLQAHRIFVCPSTINHLNHSVDMKTTKWAHIHMFIISVFFLLLLSFFGSFCLVFAQFSIDRNSRFVYPLLCSCRAFCLFHFIVFIRVINLFGNVFFLLFLLHVTRVCRHHPHNGSE